MTKMGAKLDREQKIANALLKQKLRYAKMLTKRQARHTKDKKGVKVRQRLIPLKKLKIMADQALSLWVRKRDGFRCVTPDLKCKGCMQGSHLIKKGRTRIRWEETNVHCQCAHHNYNHDQGFRPSPEILTNYVINKYGVGEYNRLCALSKEEVTSLWIRNKATEVIEKYK